MCIAVQSSVSRIPDNANHHKNYHQISCVYGKRDIVTYILLQSTIGLVIVWYIVKVSVKQLCSLKSKMGGSGWSRLRF